MENQLTDVNETNLAEDAPQDGNSRIPNFAFGFALYPFILWFFIEGLSHFTYTLNPFLRALIFVILLIPLPAGLILGIVSLCLGKKWIGKNGVTRAKAAITLQVVCIILFLMVISAQVGGMY